MALKWGKRAFFQSAIGWLAFKTSGDGVRPLVGKADANENVPILKNISELRLFFGSISQYVKIFPNISNLRSPIRPLLSKKLVYKWDNNQSIAFEKLNLENENNKENSHLDIKGKTKLKTYASHSCLGATLEQFERGSGKQSHLTQDFQIATK